VFVFNYSTNIQPILITANFFQRNFKIFSTSLKIKEKKTAANSTYATIESQRTNQRNFQLRVAANRYAKD
jgi:hypothetical protein